MYLEKTGKNNTSKIEVLVIFRLYVKSFTGFHLIYSHNRTPVSPLLSPFSAEEMRRSLDLQHYTGNGKVETENHD